MVTWTFKTNKTLYSREKWVEIRTEKMPVLNLHYENVFVAEGKQPYKTLVHADMITVEVVEEDRKLVQEMFTEGITSNYIELVTALPTGGIFACEVGTLLEDGKTIVFRTTKNRPF